MSNDSRHNNLEDRLHSLFMSLLENKHYPNASTIFHEEPTHVTEWIDTKIISGLITLLKDTSIQNQTLTKADWDIAVNSAYSGLSRYEPAPLPDGVTSINKKKQQILTELMEIRTSLNLSEPGDEFGSREEDETIETQWYAYFREVSTWLKKMIDVCSNNTYSESIVFSVISHIEAQMNSLEKYCEKRLDELTEPRGKNEINKTTPPKENIPETKPSRK